MSIVEMKVPSVGESITEVTLSQWLKKDGDFVKLDEPICEFESDKATLEFPAEAAGKLVHVAKEGDDLSIGALVARIDTSVSETVSANAPVSAAPVKETATATAASSPAPATTASYASGHPSPAAAKMMAEKAITVADVVATGKDGRITKGDVLQAAEAKATNAPVVNAPTAPTVPTVTAATPPAQAFSREERVEKMSRMRRTIAKRLVSAKNNTAMLTTFNEVDMSAVMALRNQYNEAFQAKYGIKMGFMSLFAKACAKVLLEMPDVNAQIADESVIYHEYVDISFAISTPNGLVVPPIKNVESLRFDQIEFQLKDLAERARKGSLTLEEMQGGTFTITNGGVFGSLMSTPILNEPQSAILGMHAIKERPMVVNGQIVVRPMMYLALSYDHRIIDGSTSVTFLVKVKELLEDPTRLFLGI